MRLQAYEVVYQTMEKGEHSDSVFHRIVEQNDFLTRDKRFLKRLSYGTIERSVELDAILNQFAKIQVLKMTAPVRTVLRMALYGESAGGSELSRGSGTFKKERRTKTYCFCKWCA